MLEYFTYKKVKKHQAQRRAQVHVESPLLDEADENYLQHIVSEEGPRPPLPERPHGLGIEAGDSVGNNSQLVVGKHKENPKMQKRDAKKANRFSFLHRSSTKKDKASLSPKKNVSADEAAREENDINQILDDLNLAAVNNRAFSVSKESQQLLQKFTVILKDLINGVPTAYDDLTHLLDNSQGTLQKSYDSLPSFLKKLVTQLPTKFTGLGPEFLAVATEAQGLGGAEAAAAGGGLAGAAKSFLKPSSLKDLVGKPGAVVSMLKAVMNALKMRWPAFMGTNVLLSLGLFVLLFVFWYCHKRGRETRLEREKLVDSNGRIIELEDDAMLGEAGNSRTPSRNSRSDRDQSDRNNGYGNGHGNGNSNGNTSTSRNELKPGDSVLRGSEQSRRPRSSENVKAGNGRST